MIRPEYGSTSPEGWRLVEVEQGLLLLLISHDLGIGQRIRLGCRVPRNAGEATRIQAAQAVDRRWIT